MCMDTSYTYDLSILIRVRNERDALERLLALLNEQHFDGAFELVVVDNESDDDSAQVALSHGAQVFLLPRHLFTYGRAINIGISRCRADLIMLLSAHVWPQQKTFLQSMVDDMKSRPTIDAAYCTQIPAQPIGSAETLRFSMFPTSSCVIDENLVRLRTRNGLSLYQASYFSNSACILRREAVCLCPMRDLPYAEENAFALDLIMRGRSVAYYNSAAVFYEGPVSPSRLYDQSRRQMIAEKLIEDRYGPVFECERGSIRTTLSASVGGALIPVTLIWIAYRIFFDRRYKIGSRALTYDICAVRGVWGRLVGALTWRRFRSTIEMDPVRLRVADTATTQLDP